MQTTTLAVSLRGPAEAIAQQDARMPSMIRDSCMAVANQRSHATRVASAVASATWQDNAGAEVSAFLIAAAHAALDDPAVARAIGARMPQGVA